MFSLTQDVGGTAVVSVVLAAHEVVGSNSLVLSFCVIFAKYIVGGGASLLGRWSGVRLSVWWVQLVSMVVWGLPDRMVVA
jgi:hypothetical protein